LYSISLLLLLFNLNANGILPTGNDITVRHNTQIHILVSQKITHQSETKHSTPSYTNNKGHIAHDEYNEKSKAMGCGGL
jgi:hypothetical protein